MSREWREWNQRQPSCHMATLPPKSLSPILPFFCIFRPSRLIQLLCKAAQASPRLLPCLSTPCRECISAMCVSAWVCINFRRRCCTGAKYNLCCIFNLRPPSSTPTWNQSCLVCSGLWMEIHSTSLLYKHISKFVSIPFLLKFKLAVKCWNVYSGAVWMHLYYVCVGNLKSMLQGLNLVNSDFIWMCLPFVGGVVWLLCKYCSKHGIENYQNYELWKPSFNFVRSFIFSFLIYFEYILFWF